jgi:hypothetical protein
MTMSLEELKENAAALAMEMRAAGEPLPLDVRRHFIDVRAALFQRGVFDPVLSRFDSATQPRADAGTIAEELEKLAESLNS